jgi:hypothetical protein
VVQPSGTIQVVNLSAILTAGKADTLKPLLPGTTVDVQAKLVPGNTYASEDLGDREPLVYVTGHVVRPGPVPVKEHMSIHDAIAQAGGVAATGDLTKVSVVSKGVGHPVSHALDLRPQATVRGGMDYLVNYEDIVIVGQKGGGLSTALPWIAAVTGVVTTILLVIDRY